MKLNTYLYEEIGSSKAENIKSKMWNEDFADKFHSYYFTINLGDCLVLISVNQPIIC